MVSPDGVRDFSKGEGDNLRRIIKKCVKREKY